MLQNFGKCYNFVTKIKFDCNKILAYNKDIKEVIIVLQHAILVKDDYVVCQQLERIYDGDFSANCNAIMKVFITTKQEEIEGGILFVDGCPGISEAAMIISAKLSKVVINRDPVDSDELCAKALLEEKGVLVVLNENNIFIR